MNLLTSLLSPDIQYQNLILVIGIWFLALWLMFCLWVFMDAQKRYKKLYISILLTLVVFVFNFPALIFYLIIRPEESWEDMGLYEIDQQHGGVNVPVINFVGTDGKVQLSLNLTVAPKQADSADMTVDIGWDSNQESMKIMETKPRPTMAQMDMPEVKVNPLSAKLESFRAKAMQSMRNTVDTSIKKADKYSEELNESMPEAPLTTKPKNKKNK